MKSTNKIGSCAELSHPIIDTNSIRIGNKKKFMKLFYLTILGLITFNFSVSAQTNIIVDQTNWPSGNYVNASTNNPQTNDLPKSSYWCSGTASLFNGTNGTLVSAPIAAGSSFTCWTYFAPSNAPVTLSPGYTIQMILNYMEYGTAPSNINRGLRFGLLYSGANQSTNTGTVSGENVNGYAQNMNYGTVFAEAPLQTVAVSNVNVAGSILASSGVLIKIGSNGGGNTNDAGFVDGVPYTLIMTISERNTNSVSVTTTFLGSTLTNGMISQTVIDTNFCCTNFDTFCLRPANGGEAATNFTFTSFQVTTFPSAGAGPFTTVLARQSTNTILSWQSTAGVTYSIYRTNSLTAPTLSWKQIVTSFPAGGAAGGTIFYTDKPSGDLEFYQVTSP